ncbi:DivIVA domain-containing protein [Demequina lignilytica]|uniref:Cell wall synthesis protein Wag31 n=1 Tax=Demequina lignilytica TaxID=3051663 RepID=A0AAW7M7T4_9MICO|nr:MULTISPECIES: DivIVA domain-containing protein [unclassified Demequina]MDN4477107.1 DivIVA domain-containing protein [Demequina sp. SYSU T00039-1]MDN4483955.1 DivIVA domain-containing protein [Demequina sp. SYSU T0a273]MDN4487280.1 DivIVA domain-containing protein [Demequina sp. SYSU T00039]MDN4491531.1 DivIVA domain-containing protein [Demequina sp. SYSU T00068]
MALLTAEDVLNKAFSKTKYREGFDQDEVDDFLDEVAHSISQLTAERDELAARLREVQQGGGAAPAAEAPATDAGLLQAATDPNPPTPTGMLAMAQKLHDEYVAAGEEEKERLVEEGKAKAESIVERAENDAQARMDQLNSERALLETKIDDLRRFERDYRSRLKSYLSNLLDDLDHAEGTAPAPAAPFVGEELIEEPAVEETVESFGEETPADEPVDEAPASEEPAAEADAPAEDQPEEESTSSPALGTPYTPPTTQFGGSYTPQQPWAPTADGDAEPRA